MNKQWLIFITSTCNFYSGLQLWYTYLSILIFNSVSILNNWRMFNFPPIRSWWVFFSLPCSMFNPYHFTHKWFFQQINTKCRKTSNPKMFFFLLFCPFCSALLLPSDWDSFSKSDFHSLFRYVCISMATTDIFYCSNLKLLIVRSAFVYLYRDIGFMMILLLLYWWCCCCLFSFTILILRWFGAGNAMLWKRDFANKRVKHGTHGKWMILLNPIA